MPTGFARRRRWRIRNTGHDRAGQQRTDAGYLHQPAACLGPAGIGQDAPVVVEDLLLDHLELGAQHRKAGPCLVRQSRIILIGDDSDQPIQSPASDSCGDAELGHVGAQGVADLGALPRQDLAHPVQHHGRLLVRRLRANEPHRRPGHRFADRLGIGRIVLAALHIGLHVLRRHQLDLVPQRGQLTRPVVGRGARFHTDEAGRQLLEQLQQLPPRKPAPQHRLALRVDTVNLENRLCQIQPNNRYLFHRHSPLRLIRRKLPREVESRPRHQLRTLGSQQLNVSSAPSSRSEVAS